MSKPRTIAYLAEPHAFKTAFFQAVGDVAGGTKRQPTWRLSTRAFPETRARAEAALARAKKQPKGPFGRWLKAAFLRGRYNWARRYFAAHPSEIALCWQGLTGTRRAFMEGAQDAGVLRLFAELAPLPGRLTLDAQGVNAEGSVPQGAEFYDEISPDAKLLSDLKNSFKARAPRRKDVGQATGAISAKERFLFVPLQVPDDSQMLLFAGWCGGLSGFVDALVKASQALPEGWFLRLKEHPSSKVAMTEQITAHIKAGARMMLDNDTDSFAQIEASQGVVTVNSSMGLQAMFFDKPVVVTGQALFGFDGVATPADSFERLVEAFKSAGELSFDQGLRQRFLTWLARDYYIEFDGTKLAKPEQVLALISADKRH